MKARKTMKNNALIQEVISQISQRFSPKIPDIKKVCEIHDAFVCVAPDGRFRPSTPSWRRSILSEWRAPEIPSTMSRNCDSFLLSGGSYLGFFGSSYSLYVARSKAAFFGSCMNIDIL
jgi:hypothetical protein